MFFYVNNNNDNDTKFSCPICYEEYCFKCKTNYHHDETCTEYRKRVEGDSKYDAEFFNLVSAFRYKKCPNCNYFVEKDTVFNKY